MHSWISRFYDILQYILLNFSKFFVLKEWEKIVAWSFKTPVGMSHCILGCVVPLLIVLQHVLGFLTLNKSATARPIHKVKHFETLRKNFYRN